MAISSTTILLVLIVTSLVAITWRLASRRHSLPCPVWLRWLVELDNPFTKTNRAKFIVETLDLSNGMAVLDAGCGPGRLTVPLAKGVGPNGCVVALDIQPGMLARAKAKTEAADCTNVDFVAAALGDGKLPANYFDRVVLVTVLGEIPYRVAAFDELFQALKPGGILAVVEVIFDPHFQSRKVVTALAAATGLYERAFFGHRLASFTSRSQMTANQSVKSHSLLGLRGMSKKFHYARKAIVVVSPWTDHLAVSPLKKFHVLH